MIQDNQEQEKCVRFSRAYPSTGIAARYKVQPEDFQVDEIVAIEPSGDGEHCWLFIEKKNCNTDWVAKQLARYCGIKPMAVSYAGLKDRHAVTRQWFSVHLPGKEAPDWERFEQDHTNDTESIQILNRARHHRKLKRGALQGNRFRLRLRELSDASEQAFDILGQRCELIAQRGVPNYFGEQRFGRDNDNLQQAAKMFSGSRNRLSRHKRGIYLSAARSWIFNHILSQRIDDGNWDARLAGDVFMLDRRSACFIDESENSELISGRLSAGEIHPTAALWGDGDAMVSAQAKRLETRIIDQFPVYRDGLLSTRVQAARRACRVIPGEMSCRRSGDDFELTFVLPSGSYATSVLNEFFSELEAS